MKIPNNTIIICENSYKQNILRSISAKNILLNIKFYTKKEFFKEYLFSYDYKTILYIKNRYDYKLDIIKEYLNNLYYINNIENSENNKINFLINLKKELDENNLLIYNEYFEDYIKNFNIIVYGYPYLLNYELNIFNKINAKIILEEEVEKCSQIYEFETIENEVNYVLKSISKLILNGTDINKIKIVNIDNDYYNTLRRLAYFYNIPIEIPTNNTLYNNVIGKNFLNSFTGDLASSLQNISNTNQDIYKKILNICNRYVGASLGIKDLLIDDFKNTLVNNVKLQNYIEIKSIYDSFNEDEYVFIMNFNMGSIPKIVQDENYLGDLDLQELKETTSSEINKSIVEYTINKLNSIKNKIITFKLNGTTGVCYPSSLIDLLNMNIIKDSEDIQESYSKIYTQINYAKCLDNYYTYGTQNGDLEIYHSNLEIPYNTYSNKYTNINKDSLKEYLNNHLTLSYSSLNNYNLCAFKYYLANILKVDKYNHTFETFIGSLFHEVLSKYKNNDVDKIISDYIKNNNIELNNKEMFYVNKIKKDIYKTIECLNKQDEYSNFDKVLTEKNILIKIDSEVDFTGFIDKILYKEDDDNTLISIIDYKTGKKDIDITYVKYGLNMQLPVYLYLTCKSNLFHHPLVVGFYLQYLLNNDIIINKNKDYDTLYSDNLKLVGYSLNNLAILKEFDTTYENSCLIKGMKVKSNLDFGSHAKVLSMNEMDELTGFVEKNILECKDNILNGNFTINPKKIGYEDDVACKYCRFRDICYKTEEDYVIYKKEGDAYAEVD